MEIAGAATHRDRRGAERSYQAEQVRSIAVERVGDLITTLDADDIRALDDALRLHLQL